MAGTKLEAPELRLAALSSCARAAALEEEAPEPPPCGVGWGGVGSGVQGSGGVGCAGVGWAGACWVGCPAAYRYPCMWRRHAAHCGALSVPCLLNLTEINHTQPPAAAALCSLCLPSPPCCTTPLPVRGTWDSWHAPLHRASPLQKRLLYDFSRPKTQTEQTSLFSDFPLPPHLTPPSPHQHTTHPPAAP